MEAPETKRHDWEGGGKLGGPSAANRENRRMSQARVTVILDDKERVSGRGQRRG
jgi:hypothetical protein